jgi:hypothetical protein
VWLVFMLFSWQKVYGQNSCQHFSSLCGAAPCSWDLFSRPLDISVVKMAALNYKY